MTTMIYVDLRCPSCSNAFESQALASTNSFGPLHTDFRQEARGFQPRQFYVHDCQQCGFAGYEKDFEGDLDGVTKALIARHITPQLRKERALPWQKFERAAQIAIWKRHPPDEIAGTYLLAAYVCADVDGDSRSEISSRSHAIEYYSKALDEKLVPVESVPSIVYLVGELYRRIGKADEASQWLAQAEDMARSTEGLAWLADLARQQRTQPREVIER